MSGFERAETGGAWTTDEVSEFPDDFSGEEAEFASELRTLFAPEQEELPPLYIETLLSDERCRGAEPAFEHKLAYGVLRRLHLPRAPLFSRRQVWRSAIRDVLHQVNRPLAASFIGVLLLMVFTMAVTTPSFASGLSILLGHTGVRQVQSYPAKVRTSTPQTKTGVSAPLQLSSKMSVSWLGQRANTRANTYVFANWHLLDPTEWSNGPMVDLQYVLPGQAKGSGLLDIREFQVSDNYAAVLQVVQVGSATLVSLGSGSAVYVDGTWVPRGGHSMWSMDDDAAPPPFVWQSGVRSELIVEQAGVVFWIVADQRDGAGQAELMSLARQLRTVDPHMLHPTRVCCSVSEAYASLDASFRTVEGREVYQEVPQGVSVNSGVGEFVASAP
jgi:hypothetical protein